MVHVLSSHLTAGNKAVCFLTLLFFRKFYLYFTRIILCLDNRTVKSACIKVRGDATYDQKEKAKKKKCTRCTKIRRRTASGYLSLFFF